MKRLLILATVSFGLIALGETPVPEGDPLQSLIGLISQWSTLSPIALGISVIVVLVQAAKAFLGESFKFKRIIITGLGVAYGVGVSLQNGMPIFDALILGLLTSGGAVAIYEALKPLLKTLKPIGA